MALFNNLDKYKKEKTIRYRNFVLEKYRVNGEINLPKILRPERELLLRHGAEIDALHAGYIRKLALKGEKKETVLKAVEKIFEGLVVPRFGATGYELAFGKREFECWEISEALRTRVKEEYGVSAIPHALEYMDRVMESVIIDSRGNKTKGSDTAFPSVHAIRPAGGLPA
jgi:hypothetical protein